MKFYYLNVDNQTNKAVDIEPTLDNYYKYLDCDCITISTVQVCGKIYDIICDDEALLKDKPIPSVLIMPGVNIYGNVLICKDDGQGNETGLNDYEIVALMAGTFSIKVNNKTLRVIVDDNILEGYNEL